MDLKDAARMILGESADHPDLMRLSRHNYDELSAGRSVPYTALSTMLRMAARKNLFPALRGRHGIHAFNDMVIVLGREIDRQAPIPHH
ncbi:hypothetical protein ACGFNU_48705 [Spirillospora sp. NPDC048911]|uniref:hypothetical protein n=1 Tax=Spirillospora sp. NPDC048911 TaxID=3364527 RepID=UPI00371BD895